MPTSPTLLIDRSLTYTSLSHSNNSLTFWHYVKLKNTSCVVVRFAVYFEGLQDKLAQVKDARAALDALREEHREKLRREAEFAEKQRQMQMAQKLDIMRKKKQEYLAVRSVPVDQLLAQQMLKMQGPGGTPTGGPGNMMMVMGGGPPGMGGAPPGMGAHPMTPPHHTQGPGLSMGQGPMPPHMGPPQQGPPAHPMAPPMGPSPQHGQPHMPQGPHMGQPVAPPMGVGPPATWSSPDGCPRAADGNDAASRSPPSSAARNTPSR
ncbi:unnamed protein product [Nesidiocoris tenuis]|uniref:Hepatocyte growth factor-regulated tyrosine kinase substrate helical domain-containing protein n=1 Tax=Nesidiocoris tenuis TaxID=355587 RepID=A0A6H5H489_9HEMI|nr:unnamed protein product [Nesidiocoris tenuis]